MTTPVRTRRPRPPLLDRPAVLSGGTAPYRLSAALCAVTVAAAAPTLLWPSLLSGPAVMVGSARGTALVLLLATVPLVLVAMRMTARGSARALVVWLGALAHVLYQALMFSLATPLNSLFLLYVAMLGLSLWSAGVLVVRTDVRALASRFDGPPVRLVAGVLATVAVLNALAWLGRIVPTIGSDDPTSILDGSGLTTNPVILQDLALWVPLAVVAAVWLWRRAAPGFLAAGALLVFWTLEGVTVATDQLFGHAADPSTEWATPAAAVLFAVLAVVTLVPAVLHVRALDRRSTA
ncbi:MAG: hypothetical protein ACLGIG_00220 [Actinomycetes bacterium]